MTLNLYLQKTNELIDQRIATRMQFNEDVLLSELDDLWGSLNETELEALKTHRNRWWFHEEGTDKSELDAHPSAQYFVNQRPKVLGNPSELKSTTTFFKTAWKTGDAVLFLGIEKMFNEMVEIQLVSMSNREYSKLEEKYKFERYLANDIPLFSLAS
jgi:hypothetical protein